jgi:hypothetical protein
MKKIITFLLALSLLGLACNMSAAPTAVNTEVPTVAGQFTAIPTLTPEQSVQATALPTLTTVPVPPASNNGPVPIIFDVNGTYKDVSDSIPAGSSKTYSINASKGQVTSISVLPLIPAGGWGYIHMQIKGADGTLLCPQAPNTDCAFWRGTLPSSQNYFVTVTPEGDAVNFILRVAINPPGNNSQSFQYKNPSTGLSLTYSDMFVPAVAPFGNYKTAPELALQLIDPAVFNKTNLGQAYLFISSTSDPQIVSTCTEPGQATGELEQLVGNEVVNGYTFVHSTGDGAGAGNLYEQEIYRMVYKNICYEVIYYMHSSQVGNFPPEAGITEFDRNVVIQRFFSVFSTFTIK